MGEKVLTSVLGLFINKARDKAADSLKDGGVMNERFREIIVRELKDIRVKLDALCYKDLKACIEFHETGVHHLYDYFKRCGNENVETSAKGEDAQSKEEQIGTLDSFRIFSWGSGAAMKGKDTNKILARELIGAKKQFELAEEYATLAFRNDALKPFDRITAQKFRIASTILKNLDSPDTAASLVSCCKRYLEQLNSIPCVVEAFAIEAESGTVAGVKRLLSQEHEDVIEVVKAIHQSVFQFARHACLQDTEILQHWPNVLGTKEGKKIVVLPAFDKSFGHNDDDSYRDIAVSGNGEYAVIRDSLEVELLSPQSASVKTFSASSRGQAVTICFDNSNNIKVSTRYLGRDSMGAGGGSGVSVAIVVETICDIRTFNKSGKNIKTIDCDGGLSTTMCDDQGDIFAVNVWDHMQQKITPHKGQYTVTLGTLKATLKDVLAKKESETRTFLAKRGIRLAEGVKPEHDVLVLGPLGKGLAVSTECGYSERIAWNSRNGDVIFLRGENLEFYTRDSHCPIQFSFPCIGNAIAITPEGQIAVAANRAIYIV